MAWVQNVQTVQAVKIERFKPIELFEPELWNLIALFYR